MKYLSIKTIAIAALFASLAACSVFEAKDYTGGPYTGRDPKTGVSASLRDINRCQHMGGVKNINPSMGPSGNYHDADCVYAGK